MDCLIESTHEMRMLASKVVTGYGIGTLMCAIRHTNSTAHTWTMNMEYETKITILVHVVCNQSVAVVDADADAVVVVVFSLLRD